MDFPAEKIIFYKNLAISTFKYVVIVGKRKELFLLLFLHLLLI